MDSIRVTLLALFSVLLPSISSAQEVNMVWHHERDLNVSFAYPENWVPATPVESSTRFVVNWLAKTGSHGLIATCYLRVAKMLGEVNLEDNLASYQGDISKSFVAKTRARTDDLVVRRNELLRLDGKDVIYFEMDSRIKSLDETTDIRTYTVLTYMKSTEVALECGSTVPLMSISSLPQDQRVSWEAAIGKIEGTLMHVLKTLHFERR